MIHYFKQVKAEIITSVEAKSVNVASPDFVKATMKEYDGFIASLPIPEPEPDYKELYGKAATQGQKIAIIAKRLGLE